MSTTTPVPRTGAASPPVFNLSRAIALLHASAQSGIAFCTPWQPYSAGEGLRTSFLVGEGAPFSPLNGASSDAYTDIVRLEKEFYLRVIKDERRQTSHVIAPGEDWLKIAFALDGGGLARTFAQKSSYEYHAGRVEIYLHPPGVAKTEGVADGRWGSSVSLYVSRKSPRTSTTPAGSRSICIRRASPRRKVLPMGAGAARSRCTCRAAF